MTLASYASRVCQGCGNRVKVFPLAIEEWNEADPVGRIAGVPRNS